MWRSIHSVLGLTAAAFVVVLSLSGAFLATQPVYDVVTRTGASDEVSLAEVLRRIHTTNPGIEVTHLERDAAGNLKLSYSLDNKSAEAKLDPASGTLIEQTQEPAAYTWTRKLHRAFLLGDEGRVLSAFGGLAMTVLTVTGIALLLRRLGGWRSFFAAMSARDAGGFHSVIGRLSLLPLAITALTAGYLSAQSFSLLPATTMAPAYPESVEELDPVAAWDLIGLQQTPISTVNEVIFPIVEDWFDVWTVRTDAAYVFFDQFTGLELSRDPLPVSTRVMDVIRMLHTGEGAPLWAVVLMVASLCVPAFAVSGVLIWLGGRRQSGGRIRNNAALGQAEALILVGSEGGATWGFAAALHRGLTMAGIPTRTIALNKTPARTNARYIFALTSTYGDGDAPKSANRALPLSGQINAPKARFAVLAFGDKSFAAYCAFGRQVQEVLLGHGIGQLLEMTCVDRQSVQTFEQWGRLLSAAINRPLDLTYTAPRRKTVPLTLVDRQMYGETLQAPVAVLRFNGDRLPAHQAGDLVSVCPPNSDVARLYSLGSCARKDGFLEICVRKQEGGQCSGWLCGLQTGDRIDVSITRNPRFRMPRRGPVVMIGAGTGIAPFTGMIRGNKRMQPIDLFWGGRHPKSDALYANDITDWVEQGLLHRFVPAWSRVHPSRYVQDGVRSHRDHLITRLKEGATIMVCGGHKMAEAIRTEIDNLAAETGFTTAELKRRNRYLEDVY